jgi:hypothetical protein
MAYTYQMPPALDDTLTQNTIKLLSYSPILFLFNGLWMISNRQMFSSWVNSIPDSNEVMKTGHTVASMFLKPQPSTPMVLISLAFVIIIVLRATLY